MAPNTCHLVSQTIFTKAAPHIEAISIEEEHVTPQVLNNFLQAVDTKIIGISGIYGSKGILTALALSSGSSALFIRFSRKSKHRMNARQLIASSILCSAKLEKLGFDMEQLATALFYDHDLRIVGAIDIQSMGKPQDNRNSISALLDSLGGPAGLNRTLALQVFLRQEGKGSDVDKCVLRAWCSWNTSTFPRYSEKRQSVRTINTRTIASAHLRVLSKSVRDMVRLSALKPTVVKNDVAHSSVFNPQSGKATLHLTRFKTRPRPSDDQTLVIKSGGSSQTTAYGRVIRVRGKSATIVINKGFTPTDKFTVHTVGREDATPAEQDKTMIILSALQGFTGVLSHGLPRGLYLVTGGGGSSRWTQRGSQSSRVATGHPSISWPGSDTRPLNPTQCKAVEAILSPLQSDTICLIQGPPGTGKTTVIAASVLSIMADSIAVGHQGTWLVAQSNVAVKNIAEKLAGIDYWDFKLLVSRDFHFEWHEHLYHKIEANIIRSDTFGENKIVNERKLAGSRVLLCTLSMFSNPRMVAGGFTQLVPVEAVIVDEASQIEVGDYLPLLHKFGKTIKKLAFIGDDKQLAPFGQDNIGNLRSVFELKHLRYGVILLNTQYRMPRPIGDFISRHVYGGKLQTSHPISARESCRFVDIRGNEVSGENNSWKNVDEVKAVTHIAKSYHKKGMLFRIITPYDAQRNELEAALKSAELPWEDKCFCVDSFQGNEADHIIISVVRSAKLGFLTNIRRSNVMLSRCKKSMTICTSRVYLEGKASDTLLGKLGKEWGDRPWISYREVISGGI